MVASVYQQVQAGRSVAAGAGNFVYAAVAEIHAFRNGAAYRSAALDDPPTHDRSQTCSSTTFRVNPIQRLRRTGLAAMVTVYGARSTAEVTIASVRRMHDMVTGTTPSGETYCANDPELLNWVHGTAAYGFLQAYHTYVRPLSRSERDRYYAEGIPAASLYGATGAPTSEVDLEM